MRHLMPVLSRLKLKFFILVCCDRRWWESRWQSRVRARTGPGVTGEALAMFARKL
jgi:hypothetical protein